MMIRAIMLPSAEIFEQNFAAMDEHYNDSICGAC
jgi:hypothetical protein